MKAFYFLLLATLVSCAAPSSSSQPFVVADLYYRYEANTGQYTSEVKLTKRDSVNNVDTAYMVEGGVSFLNSGLRNDLKDDRFIRYKGVTKAAPVDAPVFAFKLVSGKKVSIPGTLAPFDTLLMGPAPTKNFGFVVYHADKSDFLAENETLSALFQSDDGSAKLSTITGPIPPSDGAFKFPRETVSDWPLTRGNITFIRRRTTPISMDGVQGQLVEEVYSKPVPSAMVN
ncbi:MAG: hypothetical protein AB8F78_10190 [Saprospiraceae bacterium]